MQEAMDSATLDWISLLAAGCPEAFGGQGSIEPEEPTASSHETCIYEANGARIHVKFFRRIRGRTGVTYDPRREMEAEYGALREFDRRGFASGPYRVVRALGVNEKLDCALATVYVGGGTVLSLIYDALKNNRNEEELLNALELTAGLLKKIHMVMPRSPRADGAEMFYSYLKSLLYLEELGALDGFHRRVTKGLSMWYNHKPLFEQAGVTVHGDANPSNFKVRDGVVYGFDAERSRPGRSPLLDVGTMVAELRHHCAYLAGDARKAEPYVERFLGAYAPTKKERGRMGELLPFYVSRGFFKIAMLGYWKHDYRRRLVEQGTRCIEVEP
jgi:hypothetical protein